jgi:phosphate uptake regulator
MDLIYRKLQNLGGSLYVSLPKAWTKKYKLKEKSPIALEVRSDGSIHISPKIKQTDESQKQNYVVLESNSFVVWELLKASFDGQTKIAIVSDKEISKSLRNDIRYYVDGLPSTEITEENKQRIVIQNFGYKKIPTKKLIQRLLYLVANMFDDLKDDSLEDLNYNFEQLKKFYFILVIHIRTYLRTDIYISDDSDFTPLEAMDYRMFCEKIEEIGKILRDLRLNKEVVDFYNKIRRYFNEVMEAFLKKDDKLAYYTWLKKDILLEEAKISMLDLTYENKDKIKDMLNIAHGIKDMAALI